jgi:hypothetical protein
MRSQIVGCLALLLSIAAAVSAGAVCTLNGTATSVSSSKVVGANDLYNPLTNQGPPVGRSYFDIQNSGQGDMYVAIGSNNQATTADHYLAPGAEWKMSTTPGVSGPNVPGGDVAVIGVNGESTTWSFCDY